jgi:hypothetical protein
MDQVRCEFPSSFHARMPFLLPVSLDEERVAVMMMMLTWALMISVFLPVPRFDFHCLKPDQSTLFVSEFQIMLKADMLPATLIVVDDCHNSYYLVHHCLSKCLLFGYLDCQLEGFASIEQSMAYSAAVSLIIEHRIMKVPAPAVNVIMMPALSVGCHFCESSQHHFATTFTLSLVNVRTTDRRMFFSAHLRYSRCCPSSTKKDYLVSFPSFSCFLRTASS